MPMLHLASLTGPAWAAGVLETPPADAPDPSPLDEVLLDHAHCEKKAAGTALNLLFRYPDHEALVTPLSRLVREELRHFEEVLRHLRARGRSFRRQRPSAYAGRLLVAVRGTEPERLLDTLLCCALIEARSCERMQLLHAALASRGLPADLPLAALYKGLLASEARHHRIYVTLAETIAPRAVVRARLAELAAHEARAIAALPLDAAARMHSGLGMPAVDAVAMPPGKAVAKKPRRAAKKTPAPGSAVAPDAPARPGGGAA